MNYKNDLKKVDWIMWIIMWLNIVIGVLEIVTFNPLGALGNFSIAALVYLFHRIPE